MKKRLHYILGLGLITPVLLWAPVAIAHAEDSTSSNSNSSSQSQSSEDKHTLTEAEKTELKARLEKQKTELKIKLGTAEIALIKSKCTPNQTAISTLNTRVSTNVPTRTKAYESLSSHLNTLLGKLDAKNVDTTELKTELTTLQAKITTFNTDLTAYKQALSDAKNVDCTTDPAAFKAALQTARTARDKVVKDAADIKSYVSGTIKPTLQKIRSQLGGQQSSSKEGSN